jgi:hypothetical protein
MGIIINRGVSCDLVAMVILLVARLGVNIGINDRI